MFIIKWIKAFIHKFPLLSPLANGPDWYYRFDHFMFSWFFLQRILCIPKNWWISTTVTSVSIHYGVCLTFGRQEVDEKPKRWEEDTGHDDIDDVEQWFPLDDEEEDDLLALQLIWAVSLIHNLLSRAVLNNPFPILWPIRAQDKIHVNEQNDKY